MNSENPKAEKVITPFDNYKRFKGLFKCYFINLEVTSENSKRKEDKFYRLSQRMFKDNIVEITAKAISEVEDQILVNNNNSNLLITKDLTALNDIVLRIIKKHKINHVDNINIYKHFSKVYCYFDEFYQWFFSLTESNAPPQQPTPVKEYNTSQFNEYTYNLFCHIIDEYKKNGIIKYINIWYFLKGNINKKENILFNFTQEKYKIFIKKKYSIEIKKFKKADFKYEDVEVSILQNITTTYLKRLK